MKDINEDSLSLFTMLEPKLGTVFIIIKVVLQCPKGLHYTSRVYAPRSRLIKSQDPRQ